MDTENKQLKLQLGMIEGFKEFLYERENAPATTKKYVTDIRTFYQYLDGNLVIDKKAVLNYKEWLQKEYAPSSANSMLVALNQFWEYLNVSGLKVKRMKLQKKIFLDKDKELTKQEYERLRSTAQKKNKGQLALEIETLAVTGARISELMFFTVERIRSGKVEVFNKGKRRILLLAEGLRKKLLYYAMKENIKTGSLFITKSGKPKDRSNLWREMKALEMDAGVSWKKIFPHNLRHLFARTYYQFTKDLAGLADLLGHSSMDVTRIYTAESGDLLQRQIEKMGLLKKE